MPPTMRRVTQYFSQNPLDVMTKSASELASALGTSDATIVRTAQALGYGGLTDLKRALAGSMVATTPVAGFRQAVSVANADAKRGLERSLAMQAKFVAGLNDEAVRSSIELIAGRLDQCRRVVLFGQGPTAHVVAYGAHLLRRHGRQAHVLQGSGGALADELLALAEGDGLLVFAYGQASPEVLSTLAEGQVLGLPIILVTDSSKSPLVKRADLVAVVPRGEANGMATHGATLVWLEALIGTMAILSQQKTDLSLRRLDRLRRFGQQD